MLLLLLTTPAPPGRKLFVGSTHFWRRPCDGRIGPHAFVESPTHAITCGRHTHTQRTPAVDCTCRMSGPAQFPAPPLLAVFPAISRPPQAPGAAITCSNDDVASTGARALRRAGPLPLVRPGVARANLLPTGVGAGRSGPRVRRHAPAALLPSTTQPAHLCCGRGCGAHHFRRGDALRRALRRRAEIKLATRGA
jgi:hypothetical protein